MKKAISVALVFLILCACKPAVKDSDVALLNGYWEIKTVEFPDGEHKDYKYNESYDYFETNGNSGTRSKVMPQLDGTFLANGDAEQFTVVIKDDAAFIDYVTEYAKWRETIVTLDATHLVLRNAEDKTYYYEKAQPINLTPDAQKTTQ